jgi:D-lactate dehydrogenase
VAEHAIALYLALNRHIVDLVSRVKRFDFTIDQYVGADLSGKKVGILGTGAIGSVLARILNGFGCHILTNDLKPSTDLEKRYGVVYLEKEKLISSCDVIFICLPLNEETHKLFDRSILALMKPTAILVNVARGGIVDTQALLDALDEQLLTGYATVVFEKEGGVFYQDHSEGPLQLALLERLIDHPKVLLTPHQAFITKEGLSAIARMLFETLEQWERGEKPLTEL